MRTHLLAIAPELKNGILSLFFRSSRKQFNWLIILSSLSFSIYYNKIISPLKAGCLFWQHEGVYLHASDITSGIYSMWKMLSTQVQPWFFIQILAYGQEFVNRFLVSHGFFFYKSNITIKCCPLLCGTMTTFPENAAIDFICPRNSG